MINSANYGPVLMKNPAASCRVSNQNLPSLDGRGLRGG